MFPLNKFKKKTMLVYGVGKSGYATAKALKISKANVVCWDDNLKIRDKLKKKNFIVKKFWITRNINNFDYIVVSPGIDIKKCRIKNFFKKNYNKVITDVDLFFEEYKNQNIVSITGSNGKSTTCKILEKILKTNGFKVQVGGNIGTPILELKKLGKKSVYILEISSYQLEYSKLFRSKHSVLLNIFPDHLERHKNMQTYVKIKSKIFLAQKKTDFAYLNSSNRYFKNKFKNIKSNNLKQKIIKIKKNDEQFIKKKILNEYLKNKGNLENLNFAYKIAKNFKISDKKIFQSLKNFKGLPHRQEMFFSNRVVKFINDSKATSFNASYQSLINYNKIHWIVGGLPKYKDNFYLNSVINRIKKAYIIGNSSNYFKKKLSKRIPYIISHNLNAALKNIYIEIKKNKFKKSTVLLSPAAASFDQFDNFEERGDFFKSLVKKKIKFFNNV